MFRNCIIKETCENMVVIIGAFIVIVLCLIALSNMDRHEAERDDHAKDREVHNADAIRKYKELFDDGIITEEEYNRKKDELLNN